MDPPESHGRGSLTTTSRRRHVDSRRHVANDGSRGNTLVISGHFTASYMFSIVFPWKMEHLVRFDLQKMDENGPFNSMIE